MPQRFDNTADKGILAVATVVNNQLNWIFREQPKHDMGIDVQIEIVDDKPTGMLIGAQIKTGPSHFTNHDNHLVLYGDRVHADYWLNHSLSVIIIAHLPDTNETYWEAVSPQTIIYTPTRWKINIPKSNSFDVHSADALRELASKKTSTERKMEKLLFDWPLIKHIYSGGKVVVYTEEYFHKSLGRGSFKIILIDQHGKEMITKEWKQYYASSLTGILEYHFPWADFEVDEWYYELYGDITDIADASYLPSHNPYGLFPYKEWQGEAGPYRINLLLNDLGKSFVTVMGFVDAKPDE